MCNVRASTHLLELNGVGLEGGLVVVSPWVRVGCRVLLELLDVAVPGQVGTDSAVKQESHRICFVVSLYV